VIPKCDKRFHCHYAKPTSEFCNPFRPISTFDSKDVLSISFTGSARQSWMHDLDGGLSSFIAKRSQFTRLRRIAFSYRSGLATTTDTQRGTKYR
jgi:hypothetical protein